MNSALMEVNEFDKQQIYQSMDDMNNIKISKDVKNDIDKKEFYKFLMPILITFILILVPIIPDHESGVSFAIVPTVAELLMQKIAPFITYIVLAIVAITWGLTVYSTSMKPKVILEDRELAQVFIVGAFDMITRTIALGFTILLAFEIGPEWVLSESVGQSILGDTALTIIGFFAVVTFVLPLIQNYGLDSFLSTLLQPIMKPLFKVSGYAALPLVASWVTCSAAGASIADDQYTKGQLSEREASITMSTLCITPFIFAIIVGGLLGFTGSSFLKFYLTGISIMVILAIIAPRIPPLSLIPDTYIVEDQNGDTSIPEGKNRFKYALECGIKTAKNGKYNLLESIVATGILYSILVPFLLSWGIIALGLNYYTPFFEWISYPVGYYLTILGVEGGFTIAPTTLVGFIDCLIPAAMAIHFETFDQKFVIGILSLVQVVFITETGAMILSSKVRMKFGSIIIIFLQRTIIAIPIAILFLKILF